MPKARILVAEDEWIVAEDLRQRLTRLGYQVVDTVPSGEMAVQLASALGPDLVLMDIQLRGGLDGIGAAEAIRAAGGPPVIYLTAHADDATLQRAKLTEPLGYVLKPFEERELRTVIEIALYKHHAERLLRDSERRWATTLSSIGDAVIATDAVGNVRFLNPVAERLTGWQLHEAAGRPVGDIFRVVHEQTRAPAEDLFGRALREGAVSRLAGNMVLIARDGNAVPIEDCAAPIRAAGEPVSGAVLVFRDVRDKRREEAARRRLEERLRQAEKMKAIGQLAAGVAHDFNNLLTVINGNAAMLLSGVGADHPWHELLAAIHRAGERAADMTRQLLAFGGQVPDPPQCVDPNQLLSDTAQLLRRVLGSGIATVVQVEPPAPAVMVDRGELERIVVNLVLNARDAMPHGGRLTLTAQPAAVDEDAARACPELRPGPYARLTVRDTGCGMDEATMARVFEPFFTTKEASKGTGLGLATVYGIVKAYGGHIEVASAVGRGTTFTIYLPAAPAQNAGAAPVSDELPRGEETVLVVEDEERVRTLTRRVLQMCGYTVLEARHAAEAVDVLAGHAGPVHLLVTGVVAPGDRTWADLTAAHRPELRVLSIAGVSGVRTQRPCEPGREPSVLPKPFTPQELARAVRAALDG